MAFPKKSIYEVLTSTGLPCAYSHFRKDEIGDVPDPPFVVYIGNGQYTLQADNGLRYKRDRYQVELYFTEKNPTLEASLETALVSAGYLYDKSEDLYVDDMDCFMIYYYV